MRDIVVSHLLGLIGATVGGFLGFLIFRWLLGQGLYGLIIPGAMMGLGCDMLARHQSLARGIVCAVAALFLGLYTEWLFFPFKHDDGFLYLVLHVSELKPITQMMIALGTLFGFWFGKGAGSSFVRPGNLRTDPYSKPN